MLVKLGLAACLLRLHLAACHDLRRGGESRGIKATAPCAKEAPWWREGCKPASIGPAKGGRHAEGGDPLDDLKHSCHVTRGRAGAHRAKGHTHAWRRVGWGLHCGMHTNHSEKCNCAGLSWRRLGHGGVWQDAGAILGLGFSMAFAGAMLVRQPCWTCLAG
jgi:hypothetical protein